MPASKMSRVRSRVLERRVLRALLEAPMRSEQVFVVSGRRPHGCLVPYAWVSDLILTAYGRGVEPTHGYHLAKQAVERLEEAGEVEAEREEYGSKGKEGARTFRRIAWLRLTAKGEAAALDVPPLEVVEPLPPPLGGRGANRRRRPAPGASVAAEGEADALPSMPEPVAPDARPSVLLPVHPPLGTIAVYAGWDGPPVLSSERG